MKALALSEITYKTKNTVPHVLDLSQVWSPVNCCLLVEFFGADRLESFCSISLKINRRRFGTIANKTTYSQTWNEDCLLTSSLLLVCCHITS